MAYEPATHQSTITFSLDILDRIPLPGHFRPAKHTLQWVTEEDHSQVLSNATGTVFTALLNGGTMMGTKVTTVSWTSVIRLHAKGGATGAILWQRLSKG